jgi:spermidine synthase
LGLEILLLLGFQALYGYVYHELTLLVALFMVGMAAGAYLALGRAPGPGGAAQELRLLAGLQILAAVSPLLLYGLLVELGRVTSAGGQRIASQMLFPLLALVAGWLGGFQFPLASRVYFAGASQGESSPGVLYGLDLAGACLGALALSALLIPVYGFLRTALLMAAVNLASTALVAATLTAASGRGGWAGQASRRP